MIKFKKPGTTGIYLMYFENTSLVYVGQSICIEKRINEHIYTLKSGKHTKKLQDTYRVSGIPEYLVLCECSKETLNMYEDIYIKYYDSCANGLNTLESSTDIPKPNNIGANHGMSKYSEEQVYTTLKLLIQQPILKYIDISSITKVGYQTVANIAALSEHVWLRLAYPAEYAKLVALKGTRNFDREVNTAGNRGKTYPDVRSPTGEVYGNITNVSKFMREHGMTSHTFYDLLNGKVSKSMGVG